MIAEIATHRAELQGFCQRFHARRLEIFGSAARGMDFDAARSDLDFLVEFQPLSPGDYVDAFFGLKEALEQLFGRPVDLVSAASIRNSYFRDSIERTKALLDAT
jgi:predicted nucleotidyltransferase